MLHQDAITKACSKCGEVKALSGFYKDKYMRLGYSSRCKACYNEQKRKYREENRDKLREKNRKYKEENRDIIIKKNRKYYEENRDKLREKDRKYYRKYYESNKSLYTQRAAKRRAAKKNRTPLWITDEHKQTIKLYYETRQSLTEATGIEYHVDHIIPLQGNNVSGLHVPENLQIITAEKNTYKNNSW
jgi:hypothetical protein